jgi:hypothetical protein
MLVARVTFTGSRFLLLSLLFGRAYLSHPVCLAGRRRRKRPLCRKKMEENKTSPILPHTPSITTPTPKKSKLEKHLTNIVA